MTVILPKFEPLSFLQSIQKYRITVSGKWSAFIFMTTHYGQNGLIVPPMALFLAKVRNLFFFQMFTF